MSCKAFLRSFAYQYCRHKYIRNAVRFNLSTSIKSSSFCSIDDYYYLRNAEIDWHDDFGSKFVAMDLCFGRAFDQNLTATINQEKLLRLPCSLLLRSLSRPIEKMLKKQRHSLLPWPIPSWSGMNEEKSFPPSVWMQWLIKSTNPTLNQWWLENDPF